MKDSFTDLGISFETDVCAWDISWRKNAAAAIGTWEQFALPTSMNQVHTPNHSARDVIPTVMAIYESYNWLFQWDKKHVINGVFLVLITGITRAITAVQWLS